MIRCVLCGCSRFDPEGVGCARCGGSLADRSEQCHVSENTKTKLLAHEKELKNFGITLEEQRALRKDLGTIASVASLVLGIAESLHPSTLRSLVRYLRDLAIPEEQIIRLRLDEPEKVSKLVHGGRAGRKQPKSSPVARKRSTRRPRR